MTQAAEATVLELKRCPRCEESLPLAETLTASYLALLGPASRGITGQRFEAQPR